MIFEFVQCKYYIILLVSCKIILERYIVRLIDRLIIRYIDTLTAS